MFEQNFFVKGTSSAAAAAVHKIGKDLLRECVGHHCADLCEKIFAKRRKNSHE
jgi:hypothetical protein